MEDRFNVLIGVEEMAYCCFSSVYIYAVEILYAEVFGDRAERLIIVQGLCDNVYTSVVAASVV